MATFTHVHQVLPSLHVADASGSHTLHARDALRAAGFVSELFVDQVDAPLAGEARKFGQLDEFVVPGKTAIIYQLAVGSWMVDPLIKRSEPIIVNYHNLTPASFYFRWAPNWLEAVASGRSQLYKLAKRTSHAIAVSEFNRKDLLGAGYRSTSVVAPFVELGMPASASSDPPTPMDVALDLDLDLRARPENRPATWLFVGKLLPHKAAHHLVRALGAYRRAYDPEARLVLVGGHPIESYASAVKEYARSLGLVDAVTMTGSATAAELAAAYATADVFVCLSDHEGFCFPLLEAMEHRLPVVAYAAGAVGDTLGDAGILLHDKSGPEVAAAVHRAVSDAGLREHLVRAGTSRIRAFDLEHTKAKFAAEVTRVLSGVDPYFGVDPEDDNRSDIDASESGVGERKFAELGSTGSSDSNLGGRVVRKAFPANEPVRAVHQLVPMVVPGDATSDHAIQLRRLLHDMGLDSEIFATAIHDDLHKEALLAHELPDRTLPQTLFIYQMSSGSPMVELARMRKEPLAVNYHNITPASTYDGWEPEVAADQRWARRQLANLAPRTSLGICDSGYNASELQSFGYRATAVCPVLVDMNRFGETSAATGDDDRNHSRAGHRTWLFVGRIAPHKAQHRLVQALAAYVELYGPGPVLHLVGRPGSFRYAEAVRHTAQQLGVAEMVHIVGGIGDHELGGFYRDADVFVSASVHEGFCVPIVEAMHHGVPVVAYSATAVPETVNGAALLVQRSDPEVIAAAVHSVSNDPNLRERLVRAGVERSAQLSLEPSRATMRAVLQRWVDGHGHYVAAIPEPRIAPARSASATR